MQNKEVLEKLTVYFLQQDAHDVCRTLAGCMLDLHRIWNYEHLGKNEKENLCERLDHNVEQLVNFIENWPNSPLTIGLKNSQDDTNDD